MNLGNILSKKLKFVLIVGMLLLTTLWVAMAAPDPVGASVARTNSSKRGMGTVDSETLVAGNITEVLVTGDSLTQSWSGIVGNVSTTLVLDDASVKSLYTWTAANPSGEVYTATVANVNWASGNVKCFNLTAKGPEVNATALDTTYGIVAADADGVADTFAIGTHPAFTAGANSFTANKCPTADLYTNDAASVDNTWAEVLLYEDTQNLPIYASIINQNANGYNNEKYDFQSIVLENGHGNTVTTTYYFYVELA